MVAQCGVDEERVGSKKGGCFLCTLSCEVGNDAYDVSSTKAASNHYDYTCINTRMRQDYLDIYLENNFIFFVEMDF